MPNNIHSWKDRFHIQNKKPLRLRAGWLLVFFLLGGTISPLPGAHAQEQAPATDRELAEKFVPTLHFHQLELFRPQEVDVLLDNARLRQGSMWSYFDVLLQVSPTDLVTYNDISYHLDSWLGDDSASDYKNYTAHRAFYQAVLSPYVGGPPVVTYAHVVRDEVPGIITIQYWLFYYYNDAFNKHEGDWEFAEVILSSEGEPKWLVLSQHHGGTRRAWEAVPIVSGTHPAVYVALGSHANYFWGNESYPQGVTIGNVRVELMDRTGITDPTTPRVILLPDREQVAQNRAAWAGFEWLLFRGRWGEVAPQADFSGPFGPADKGEQWEQPYRWGMDQPLDTGVWYANRLRVEVSNERSESVSMALVDASGTPLSNVDWAGNTLLLHEDPDERQLIAEIVSDFEHQVDLLAVWPDPKQGVVNRYTFKDLAFSPSSQARIRLSGEGPPTLNVTGNPTEIEPSEYEQKQATWNSPDVVWMLGLLPASEVGLGLLVSLVAGVLPAILFASALYHSDAFEKEPRHFLAAVFLWGAIPSILLAVLVRVFFSLPPEQLSPEAIVAVRSGFVVPIFEEGLKGAAVLFIARRYRDEFDDLLDGIIYGAMTGFGFAMTANIISYLGAFTLHGFLGLGGTIFVEGIVYGLNQAMYTAIFGAGLGIARLMSRKWPRILIPIGAFLGAVAANGAHKLLLRNSFGLDAITVILTWAGLGGLLITMTWALSRQRRWVKQELDGEVPEWLFETLTKPGGILRGHLNALIKDGQSGYWRSRHLYQLCGELAQKKMQLRTFPEEGEVAEIIQQLREEIQSLLPEQE